MHRVNPVRHPARAAHSIGERVRQGDPLATIGETLLLAPLDGILCGLTHDNVLVEVAAKVIEIDPRCDVNSARGISERPRRISIGVAAAIDEFRRSAQKTAKDAHN